MRKIAGLLLICSVAFAACLRPDDGRMTVQAAFSDVGDLFTSAPVMLADVQIGKVTEIELDGAQALVTMDIERSARVPSDVVARVRRTSLLGERIVDLVVPPDLPTDAPLLGEGDRIAATEARADLEDLVLEGTDVLAPIAASELATMINEGGEGFGGRGEQLGTLLVNFEAIVRAYSGRTDEIRGVISNLNAFNSVLATRADAHARAVANSAQGIGMLADEAERLHEAVRALGRLAVGSRSLFDAHLDEMSNFFAQMRTILDVLREEEASIRGFLQWAPGHNRGTQTTEYQDFVQVVQDFVICGLNDDPDDPARNCVEGTEE
ncbi:MAG: MCE family protein [Actinomycetota bacterium]|nr:MCE family protein [Actinomycetota bacterium]